MQNIEVHGLNDVEFSALEVISNSALGMPKDDVLNLLKEYGIERPLLFLRKCYKQKYIRDDFRRMNGGGKKLVLKPQNALFKLIREIRT